MNLNTISALMGRNKEEPSQLTKEQQITKLIRIYDSRVTAGTDTVIPADVGERLSDFICEMPSFSKRDVVLTGLAQLMDICERMPGQRVPELKVGCYESRAQMRFCFRIPLELEDRLRKLLRSLPGIAKRHVITAGLDRILTQCETINGEPFASADVQPASREAGQ
jgi:hypothetical protein